MANTKMAMCVTLVVAAMLWSGATAQSGSGCTTVLISMSPCLNYIQGNSSTPSSQCCSQLSSVVRSSPLCLCQVLNGGSSSLGINVNQTQALALPGACNVQTPAISQCNAASPSDSPAGSPDDSTTVPSGTGSKTSPSTPDGSSSSDGSSINLSFSLLICILLAASQSSIFTIY